MNSRVWPSAAIWNSAASVPPVIENVVGPPTVSGSVAARLTTVVEFSATLGVAEEVNVGATSLTSVSVTVMSCGVVLRPSEAVTCTS